MALLTIKTPKQIYQVEGEASITIEKTSEDTIVCTGLLAIPYYYEEIIEIRAPRFTLKSVDIFREDFGTSEENIIYSFKAEEWDINNNI